MSAPVTTLSLPEFMTKLYQAREELVDLGPAPRVELDRTTILELLDGAIAIGDTLQDRHRPSATRRKRRT